jgi:hypothetical protein
MYSSGLGTWGSPHLAVLFSHSIIRKFVEGQNTWLDEQTVRYLPFESSFLGFNDAPSQFQELFFHFQALPGPASTKMGFCIA